MAFQFNPLTGQFDLVGLTFPDLASPPGGTALGSEPLPFDSINVDNGLVWDSSFSDGFNLRIGPPESDLNPAIQGYVADETVLITNATRNTGLVIEASPPSGQFALAQYNVLASSALSGVGFEQDVIVLRNSSESYSVIAGISGSSGASGLTLRAVGAYVNAFGGSVDLGMGFYSQTPLPNLGTIGDFIGFWQGAITNTATNGYSFWHDEQGVFRIRADNTFNSVYQAIPALYNPQFTKYTPGAANFERIVFQWESNVGTLTTEKGGTGTLRSLNLGDDGVQVQVNSKNLTLSGNLTTTGAFNPTFAIPSSSTWTFPSGGGTLSTSTGTVTSIATTSPISGGTITGTGTISLLVNTDFLFTESQSITKAISATSTDGLLLTNTTPATVGAQKWSPRYHVTGQGWKTASTAGTQTVDFIWEQQPVQAATTPISNLVFSGQVNAGGYAEILRLSRGTVGEVGPAVVVPAGVLNSPGLSIGGGTSFGASGFYQSASGLVYGASSTAYVSIIPGVGFVAKSDYAYSWGSGTPDTNSPDTVIRRDAARTVALRDGTNAYKFRVYNTFTTLDTAGEWFAIDWITTANVVNLQAVKGSSSGTARVMTLSYGGAQASPVAAITIPITSGNIVFGGGVQLSNAAVTGLVAGTLAASTNASIVLYDSGGQAYRVPCII